MKAKQLWPPDFSYRISSYTFRGNYSFLNLEIQRSQYIRAKVTVHKCAETIQGRKLYEELRYIAVIYENSILSSKEKQYMQVTSKFITAEPTCIILFLVCSVARSERTVWNHQTYDIITRIIACCIFAYNLVLQLIQKDA